MRYEVTSYNTKRLLADTLKELMSKKPFSKIKVTEIIEACGVNRKTFYYHFEDIYALLRWVFEQEAARVMRGRDFMTDFEGSIRFAMEYVEQNDYVVSCAYDPVGREEMKRFFASTVFSMAVTVIDAAALAFGKSIDEEFKQYVAAFYTEAISGMFIEWIKSRDKHEKEKVLGYMTSIIELTVKSMELM